MVDPSDAACETLPQHAQPAFIQHGLFDGEVKLIRRKGERHPDQQEVARDLSQHP